MDSAVIPHIEDLSEPERTTPCDPKRIEEINQMITNIGRKSNLPRKNQATFARKVKRSNSHCSNKTSTSTVTVISKHSIPPELLKSRELGMTASSNEDARAPKSLSSLSGKAPNPNRFRKPVEITPLESVMEVP